MTSLADRIRRIAPQYQPDAEDLRSLEVELDRVTDRALPKLIRKRFVETLRNMGRNGPRSQVVATSAKPPAPGTVGGLGASVVTK